MKTTILVSSCDKYSDLWAPFFNLFELYWKDCPYEILLITEELDFLNHKVKSLKLGPNKTWSLLLSLALKEVKTKSVILLLEDFFIQKNINQAKINNSIKLFHELDINMLRLIPRPGPDERLNGADNIGIIYKHSVYRVSTQATLWNVNTLNQLIVLGENAWEFELNATKRSLIYDKFYCVYKSLIPYNHHVVERGKWFPWYALKFKTRKIEIDLSKRKLMNIFDVTKWIFFKIYNCILTNLKKKNRNSFSINL